MQNFILHNKKVLLAFTHSCCCDHMWSWCQRISPLCVSCPKWCSYPRLPRDLAYEVLFLLSHKGNQQLLMPMRRERSTIIFYKNLTVTYFFLPSSLLYWNNEGHWPLLLNYHWGSRFSWVNVFKTWTCINHNLWNILELDKVVSHLIIIWINHGPSRSCIMPISFCGC